MPASTPTVPAATAASSDRSVPLAGVHHRGSGWVLMLLPLAAIVIHLPFLTRYGWFRDELYYLASADHLAWGFVDQPPLAVALLAGWRAVFGDSLEAIRMLGILAGAMATLFVGLLARRMGGGRFATALAGVCYLTAPVFLGVHHFYTIAALEPALWLAAGLLLLRALDERSGPATWIGLGAVVGLALLSGTSGIWLAAGIGVSLFLVAPRQLTAAGPWVGATAMLAVAAPYLIWNQANGWPAVRSILAPGGQQTPLELTPAGFVSDQVLSMNPATLPVWLVGLAWLWSVGRARPFRALGVVWVVSLLALATVGASRPGFLPAATTFLLAGGAVAWEGFLAGWSPYPRRLALAGVTIAGVILCPLGLPVLPVPVFLEYAEALGVGGEGESGLPKHYAQMHGWDALVEEVAQVARSLPPTERARLTIFASTYGEAGAIDRLGREHGLPPAVSGHNSYWDWGPRGFDGEVTIGVGGDREFYERHWTLVTLVTRVECGACAPPGVEGRPVWIARGLHVPLDAFWGDLRRVD